MLVQAVPVKTTRCSSTHQLRELKLEDGGNVPDPVGKTGEGAPETRLEWQLFSGDIERNQMVEK